MSSPALRLSDYVVSRNVVRIHFPLYFTPGAASSESLFLQVESQVGLPTREHALYDRAPVMT